MHRGREVGMSVSERAKFNDCTGSTCMKWAEDGSLSDRDQAALMRRLCASDPFLAQTDACRIDGRNAADR